MTPSFDGSQLVRSRRGETPPPMPPDVSFDLRVVQSGEETQWNVIRFHTGFTILGLLLSHI